MQTENRIKKLPREVADKIAAGEVVDRPASIVKELVENSIDAGATSITVEIQGGGKSYIRVTDNGRGISSEDVETAFLRHATSKIASTEDLDKILTLGFRGEALASIAAVTKTELITKSSREKTGVKILLEEGRVIEKTPTGAPEGTTVIVRDLFYHIPARLKFLKQDHTESARIIDLISKLSLAYPQIRFRIINQGKVLFSTTGKGDVLETIMVLFGKEIGENLISFAQACEDPCMSLEAYVSGPGFTRTSRRSQFFFVNGRYVSDKILEQAVSEGYRTRLMEGRYPAAFLFFHISPEEVDVNIHPNKREVRFHRPAQVRTFVAGAISENLDRKAAIPLQKGERILGFSSNKSRFSKPFSEGIDKIKDQGSEEKQEQTGFFLSEAMENEGKQPVWEAGDPLVTEVREERARPYTGGKNAAFKEPLTSSLRDGNKAEKDPSGPEESFRNALERIRWAQKESVKGDFDFKSLKVLGILFRTYIAAADEKSFYLIDQHAAHERVFFEAFLKSFQRQEAPPQLLLTPLVMETDYGFSQQAPLWMDFLSSSGFQIEIFGMKSFVVRAIPSFMSLGQAEEFLRDFVDQAQEDRDFTDQRSLEKIIMHACKSAVKANDTLHPQEVERLLSDLAMADNPYSCPHGRPVIVTISKYEMEKMFKRV